MEGTPSLNSQQLQLSHHLAYQEALAAHRLGLDGAVQEIRNSDLHNWQGVDEAGDDKEGETA